MVPQTLRAIFRGSSAQPQLRRSKDVAKHKDVYPHRLTYAYENITETLHSQLLYIINFQQGFHLGWAGLFVKLKVVVCPVWVRFAAALSELVCGISTMEKQNKNLVSEFYACIRVKNNLYP